jgi:hypothetical protein
MGVAQAYSSCYHFALKWFATQEMIFQAISNYSIARAMLEEVSIEYFGASS